MTGLKDEDSDVDHDHDHGDDGDGKHMHAFDTIQSLIAGGEICSHGVFTFWLEVINVGEIEPSTSCSAMNTFFACSFGFVLQHHVICFRLVSDLVRSLQFV